MAAAFANLINGDKQTAGGKVANGVWTGALDAGWTSGAATGDTVVFTGTANTAMAVDLVASAKATVTTTTPRCTAVTAQNTLGVTNGTVTIAGAAALKTVTVDGYAASTGAAGINGATNTALDTISLANGGNCRMNPGGVCVAAQGAVQRHPDQPANPADRDHPAHCPIHGHLHWRPDDLALGLW